MRRRAWIALALLSQCAAPETVIDAPYDPAPRRTLPALWPEEFGPVDERGRSLTFGFGVELAAAGDLDGDGSMDFLVGDVSGGEREAGIEPARVFAVSGESFQMLWSVGVPRGRNGYRLSLSSIGDANDDGVSDVAVGLGRLDDWVDRVGTGGVRVLCGRSGERIDDVDVPEELVSFGYDVQRVGDLDGDGVEDFVCTAARVDEERVSVVLAYSTRTQRELHRAARQGEFAWSPRKLAEAGDLNADGVDDYWVDYAVELAGAWTCVLIGHSGVGGEVLTRVGHMRGEVGFWSDPSEPSSPCALLRGTRSTQLLTMPEGEVQGVWNTRKLGDYRRPTLFPDWNGDGIPELLVESDGGLTGIGSLALWPSGDSRPAYFIRPACNDAVHFARDFAVIGDVDEDGTPDLAVGVDNVIYGRAGRVDLVSTRTGSSLGELRREGDGLVFRSPPEETVERHDATR